jgi:hypothetical protein
MSSDMDGRMQSMMDVPETINDGGPAFPPMHDPKTHVFGMILRDYFAAKAMHAYLSLHDTRGTDAEFAEVAYRMADAMIAERSK